MLIEHRMPEFLNARSWNERLTLFSITLEGEIILSARANHGR